MKPTQGKDKAAVLRLGVAVAVTGMLADGLVRRMTSSGGLDGHHGAERGLLALAPLGACSVLIRDLFRGSGSAGRAALLEDRQFPGVALDETQATAARASITHWAAQAGSGQPGDDAPSPEAGSRTGRKPRSAGRP